MDLRTGLVVSALLSGCSLYFDNGDDDALDGGTFGDAALPSNVVARSCIRAVAVGDFMLGGNDEIFLTYVCDAPGAGGIIEYLTYTGGALVAGTARADYQEPFVRATVGNDGQLPSKVLTIQQYNPGGWVFASWGGYRYASTRPIADAVLANFDNMAGGDFVFAGDNAIRMQDGLFPQGTQLDEIEVLSGKPFTRVAVANLGGDAALDLFFVASSQAGNELGIAIQTAPKTFSLGDVVADPATKPVPLVVADVDGDQLPDVIGGTSHLFVRSSKTGTLTFLEEQPAEVATGDVNGDGVVDAVYLTADRTQVRRVVVSATGLLTSAPLLASGGDAFAIGDLDGDHRGDIVLLHGIGTTSSTMSVHLATTY